MRFADCKIANSISSHNAEEVALIEHVGQYTLHICSKEFADYKIVVTFAKMTIFRYSFYFLSFLSNPFYIL